MNQLSQRPAAIASTAGLGILAGYMYTRPKAEKSQPVQASASAKTKQAQIKRDLGMSGAGIGANVSSGSTELEDPKNPGRSITREASSSSSEKSPPMNQRAGGNSEGSATLNPPMKTGQASFGSNLFAKSSGDRSDLEGHRNTVQASNLTDAPTKRS